MGALHTHPLSDRTVGDRRVRPGSLWGELAEVKLPGISLVATVVCFASAHGDTVRPADYVLCWMRYRNNPYYQSLSHDEKRQRTTTSTTHQAIWPENASSTRRSLPGRSTCRALSGRSSQARTATRCSLPDEARGIDDGGAVLPAAGGAVASGAPVARRRRTVPEGEKGRGEDYWPARAP